MLSIATNKTNSIVNITCKVIMTKNIEFVTEVINFTKKIYKYTYSPIQRRLWLRSNYYSIVIPYH